MRRAARNLRESEPMRRAIVLPLTLVGLASGLAFPGRPAPRPASAGPPGAGRADKPFGIGRRVPWTTSRLTGSPDPPHPYRIERAFPRLRFKNPLLLARAPGLD